METKYIPMSDKDIRHYLPNANILLYRNLPDTIEQLLPRKGSYCMILYEQQPMCGHWVCLTRNKTINYFDSYGGKPDNPIKYTEEGNREAFGMGTPKLTHLLENSKIPVKYNNFDYQKKNPNIATCGRHCVAYILSFLKGATLREYKQFVDGIKKYLKSGYDEAISEIIDK